MRSERSPWPQASGLNDAAAVCCRRHRNGRGRGPRGRRACPKGRTLGCSSSSRWVTRLSTFTTDHRPRTACEHRCPCRHTENPRFDGVAPTFVLCGGNCREYYLRKPGFRATFDAATDTLSNHLFKEEHDSQAGAYLRALRRRWLLILALVVLAGWTAVAYVATADKYEAARTFSSLRSPTRPARSKVSPSSATPAAASTPPVAS